MNYWAMALPTLIYITTIGMRSVPSHIDGDTVSPLN